MATADETKSNRRTRSSVKVDEAKIDEAKVDEGKIEAAKSVKPAEVTGAAAEQGTAGHGATGGETTDNGTTDNGTTGNGATPSNAVKVEDNMAEQTKSVSNGEAGKSGKLELAQKPEPEANEGHAGLTVREPRIDEIEVAESFTSAGLRPIAASHLEIFGTILNNRPIMASHLHVMEYALPGNRPIFASDMIVRDDLTLPGGRPIMASDPKLLEASMIMGGRPIADNDLAGEGESLMGYLD